MARVERADDGLVVDDGGAREVENHTARPHEPKMRIIHEVARIIIEGYMHRDRMRARKEILDRERLLDACGQLPGALHRELRIVAENLHPEAERGIGGFHADGAKADDAE